MGFDYAITVYYKNERVRAAIEDLRNWADLERGETSQISLPDGTQMQVPFLQDHWNEWSDVCLTTSLFLAEDSFYIKYIPYLKDDSRRIRRKMNLIDVGNIYIYLRYGDRYSSLDFTAATTDMSMYFLESPGVHQVFYDYAIRTQAEIALFDIENGQSYPLLTNRNREIGVWSEPTFGGSPDAVMACVTEEDREAFRTWRSGTIQ